jgi:plastocyanin
MMHRSHALLVGLVLIGVLLFGGLGATLAWGAPGWMRTTSGTPGVMGPGMMGTPGQGGMMGGNQPSPWPTGAPGMGGTQVVIEGYSYHPMMLRVSRGATITWTDEDNVPHSVTFRNGMADSGLLKEGQTFQYTFQTAGTYQYYCSAHPYMRATVTVTP